MDLNALQIFTQVVDHGGFTAAARIIGSNKATVSRKVAELEQQLGVRLLARNTRRMDLTKQGEQLYQRCRGAVTLLEEAENELTKPQHDISGSLRLVMPIEFGQVNLGKIIGEFTGQYPQLSIYSELTNRKVDMIAEGIDLAFRIGLGDDDSLVARRITSTRLILVASPGYLDLHGEPVEPEELQHHKILSTKAAMAPSRWILTNGDDSYEFIPEGQLASNNITFLREAANQDAGIVLLPELLVEQAIQQGRLQRVLPQWQAKDPGIYVMYPDRRFLPVKVRLLLDFIIERLPPDQQSLAGLRPV